MAHFTRDEVILALDVLYASENGRVTADSDEIKELSLLLNRLPIHPLDNRGIFFRNAHGIANQLMQFISNCKTGKKSPNVGNMFFEVAFEYEERKDELHLIAEAIRHNEKAYFSVFGALNENDGFPEGSLLGHLHRIIEQRDGVLLVTKDYCEVCNSKLALYYRNLGQLLQNHLVVAPVFMDYSKKYKSDSFLTVCPNCHAALHRYRPWLTKDNCGDVLR